MNYVIVLAGGTGKRLGADVPKQFTRIAGRPVITYVLDILENAPCVDGVVVVTVSAYRQAIREWCHHYGYRKVKWVVAGGDTCQASTYCGVKALEGVAAKDDVVAAYIFIHAIGHLRAAVDIFLEKVPDGYAVEDIKTRIEQMEGVQNAHHIHIRSIDGYTHAASLHVVSERTDAIAAVTAVLNEMDIPHVTVQVERELCPQTVCGLVECHNHDGRHHHHH